MKRIASPPKHASAEVAESNGDAQRSEGLILNKEADRPSGAVALCARFLAQAPDAPLDFAGGVLNRVRRSAFRVLDQVRNVPLQCDKILAKQFDIGIYGH